MPHIVDIDALGSSERLDLIGDIWNGLRSQHQSIPVSENVLAELERRRAAYESDPSTASLWEDVRQRILNRQ